MTDTKYSVYVHVHVLGTYMYSMNIVYIVVQVCMLSSIRHVHRAGGLCIIDEVQTGFGRGGEYFWIFETQGENTSYTYKYMYPTPRNLHAVYTCVII